MTTTRRLSLAYLALTAGVAVLFALNLFWAFINSIAEFFGGDKA